MVPVVSGDYGYLQGLDGGRRSPECGSSPFLLRSDEEPAVVGVCRGAAAAARLQHRVRMQLEASQLASSQSNWGAESSMKRVKAKIRAIALDYCAETGGGCLLP